MANLKRVVISSTQKNGKIVAQQVVYQSEGFSRTKHEKVKMIDENNLEVIQPKGK
tara:strand:+ start:2150 stop:2314 length:165 start_codon:yes stop_codon:yes gene_type:complete